MTSLSIHTASLSLGLQNEELMRVPWIRDICGEAHRAVRIKRGSQDRCPLSQRQREVSACEQCESAVGRPVRSRNCEGRPADRDAGDRGLGDQGRGNVANLKETN